MVFGLSGEDTILLRWKVTDVLVAKQEVRRIAVRIRNRHYRNLDDICNQMQVLVENVEFLSEDLFRFLCERNLYYVWTHMEEVWSNYNILALDFRWN